MVSLVVPVTVIFPEALAWARAWDDHNKITISKLQMGKIGLRYYGLVAERISRPTPDARLGNEDVDIDAERIAEMVRHALSR